MHIDTALDDSVRQLEADGRSHHTILQYRRHVRALARWAADVGPGDAIEDLGHQDLARFLNAPAARVRADGEPKKATSVNALRTSLRCFFLYVHQAGELTTNPARLIRRARCSPPPPRGITEEDLRKLLATIAKDATRAGRRDHAMFSLMAATGIRLGSAVGLDVEDLDLERGEIEIRTAKGNQPMTVYIDGDVRRLVLEFVGVRKAGPLFTTRKGNRISRRQVQRRYSTWVERSGCKRRLGVHSLRHAFAMRVYSKTRDLLLLQAAMGHASITATTVYARSPHKLARIAM